MWKYLSFGYAANMNGQFETSFDFPFLRCVQVAMFFLLAGFVRLDHTSQQCTLKANDCYIINTFGSIQWRDNFICSLFCASCSEGFERGQKWSTRKLLRNVSLFHCICAILFIDFALFSINWGNRMSSAIHLKKLPNNTIAMFLLYRRRDVLLQNNSSSKSFAVSNCFRSDE